MHILREYKLINCAHPLNYLNYFHDQGGFDALIHMLKVGNLRPAEVVEKKEEYELLPFDMIKEIQDMFYNCKALLDPAFLKKFVETVGEIIINRLDQMTDEDIKEIERRELPGVL